VVIRGEHRPQTMDLAGDERETREIIEVHVGDRRRDGARALWRSLPRSTGNARSATVIFGRPTQPCYPVSAIGRSARRAVQPAPLNGLTVPDANEFRD